MGKSIIRIRQELEKIYNASLQDFQAHNVRPSLTKQALKHMPKESKLGMDTSIVHRKGRLLLSLHTTCKPNEIEHVINRARVEMLMTLIQDKTLLEDYPLAMAQEQSGGRAKRTVGSLYHYTREETEPYKSGDTVTIVIAIPYYIDWGRKQ